VKLARPGDPLGAEAAAAADHPNVARAVAAGEEDGVRYLAVRYVDGTTAGERVRAGGPLRPADAVGVAAGAAAGLAHLHARGWVHGDVTPDNLVVGPDGAATVIDLGLAGRAGADPAAGFRGTPGFAAPEVLLGRGPADPRADVFGLGATLFYLLTGRSPYPRASAAGLVLWLLAGEARPRPRLPPGWPDGLGPVVRRLLAADPRDRYPDAAAAGAALSAAGPDRHRRPDGGPRVTGAGPTRPRRSRPDRC
jgi:serine/threonine protein kinase